MLKMAEKLEFSMPLRFEVDLLWICEGSGVDFAVVLGVHGAAFSRPRQVEIGCCCPLRSKFHFRIFLGLVPSGFWVGVLGRIFKGSERQKCGFRMGGACQSQATSKS